MNLIMIKQSEFYKEHHLGDNLASYILENMNSYAGSEPGEGWGDVEFYRFGISTGRLPDRIRENITEAQVKVLLPLMGHVFWSDVTSDDLYYVIPDNKEKSRRQVPCITAAQEEAIKHGNVDAAVKIYLEDLRDRTALASINAAYHHCRKNNCVSAKAVAEYAYDLADAMIEARDGQ